MMRETVRFAVGCDSTVDKLMEISREQGRQEERKRMSEERKADMERVLAELKFEIWLAIRQGALTVPFQWSEVVDGPSDPWFAVLTIGKVGEEPRG